MRMLVRSRPSRRDLSRKSNKPSETKQLQQQKQQDQGLDQFQLDGLPPDFGATFNVQTCVIDNLSVNFGHSVGHFSSVKQGVRQIYQLLIFALCRHDPLPLMVRSAIKSTVFPAPPPPPPPSPSPLAVRTRTLSPHQPIFEQLQRSDIETITALDIPYELRHFDFDLSEVNNSKISGRKPTTLSVVATATAAVATKGVDTSDQPIESTISFSMARSKIRYARGAMNPVSAGAYRQVADLLVDARVFATVRKAIKEAASVLQLISTKRSQRQERGYEIWRTAGLYYGGSGSENSLIQARMSAPPNSAFDTSPAASSNESSKSGLNVSSTTSASPRASLRTTTPAFGTFNLIAPLTIGLDGSNSNRANATQLSMHISQQSLVSADGATSQSEVSVGSSKTRAEGAGGAGRLCPLHADRSRAPFSESSCAVCASQHFLHRHLHRLARETGDLARLESTLNDCIRLQRNLRKSLNWVAGSVKDNRLPDSLRSLIRCICFDAVVCGQSVTVNPQIIINTDGRYNSPLYVSRRVAEGNGSGATPAAAAVAAAAPGWSGHGSKAAGGPKPGSSGHCCWEN